MSRSATTRVGVTRTSRFPGHGVATSELLGRLGPHVATADPGGPLQEVVRIAGDGCRTPDQHERERRTFVSRSRTPPRVALDRLALRRPLAGGEHDVVTIEVDPDGSDLRGAVGPDHGELRRSRRCRPEELAPPRLVRDRFAHATAQRSGPTGHSIDPSLTTHRSGPATPQARHRRWMSPERARFIGTAGRLPR